MPYVHIVTSKKLLREQKNAIKSRLGKLIEVIPGKSEQVLMVGFQDGTQLFYAGAEKDNAAYMQINLHGTCGYEEKNELTQKVFSLMEEIVGIQKEDLFLTVPEYTHWGFQGNLL